MPSPAQPRTRLNEIIRLIAAERLTKDGLRKRLVPVPSERALGYDLAKLRRMFPHRISIERVGRAHAYAFIGDPPQILAQAIHYLDEDQLAAIIAARGLLRIPNPDETPTERGPHAYHGALAQSLDRLLSDAGLGNEALDIAPDAVAISRFGSAPEEATAFPLAFAAIRTGESLTFDYTNLLGTTHAVHAKAVQLIHINGEWHLLAWANDDEKPPGKLKQYRLSRIAKLKRVQCAPKACPITGLRHEAAALLRDAFRSTGSSDPAKRSRVSLLVSPKSWPFIERRRWGGSQIIEDNPAHVPTGWRRLQFITTGLNECQYWVLSFGAEVRVESPAPLKEWIRSQAQALLTG